MTWSGFLSSFHHLIYSIIKMEHKMTMYNWRTGDIQGSVRALKAAPKLHSYDSTRDKTVIHVSSPNRTV